MGLKSLMKSITKGIIPQRVANWVIEDFTQYGNLTYAQEGEDKLLERLMNTHEKGVFVDVGAHHPRLLSNTYYFYKKGWRGINIDATPGAMDLFKVYRPEDINLEIPIAQQSAAMPFYMFNFPELNTFSEESRDNFLKWPGVKLVDTLILSTQTLANVLDAYLGQAGASGIDFFSIDVEGMDFEVLKSNNWSKYRPKFILIEMLKSDIADILSSDIYSFLAEINYDFVAKTYNTVFFKTAELKLDF